MQHTVHRTGEAGKAIERRDDRLYLTDKEKETLLTFTEGDHMAYIATYNTAIKLALRRFCQHRPALCSLRYETAEGRETYSINKSWLSVCFRDLFLWEYALHLRPDLWQDGEKQPWQDGAC